MDHLRTYDLTARPYVYHLRAKRYSVGLSWSARRRAHDLAAGANVDHL